MSEKDKLAKEVAEILKDETLSPDQRLEKMKSVLPETHKNPDGTEQKNTDKTIVSENTYDSQKLKLAAIRNKLGLKKD